MKIKRILALLLSVIMMVGMFAACKKSPSVSSDVTGSLEGDTTSLISSSQDSVDSEVNDSAQSSANESSTVKNESSGTTSSGKGNAGTTASNGTASSATPSTVVSGDVSIPERFRKLNYSGTTIKVLIWYTPQPWEQSIYDKFSEITGCKFKFIQVGTSTVSKKLTALVASNSAPDYVPLDENNFMPAVVNKLVQPITKYVNTSDSWVDWEISNAAKFAGDYYGLTSKRWGDNVFVYFNKTLFAKSTKVNKTPLDYYNEGNWTWEVFADLAEKMTVKNNSGSVTQLGCYAGLFNTFGLSAGGALVSFANNQFKNTMNSSAMKDAASFEQGLIEKGYLNHNTNTWQTGNTAMYIYPQYMVLSPETYKFNFEWDWVPFPKYTKGQASQPIQVQMGSVPKKAKNIQAAADFISWRCFCSTTMYTNIGNMPKEYVERLDKAMSGKVGYSFDASVLGNARYTIYQNLIQPKADIQSIIDSTIPQVNSSIKQMEETIASYK